MLATKGKRCVLACIIKFCRLVEPSVQADTGTWRVNIEIACIKAESKDLTWQQYSTYKKEGRGATEGNGTRRHTGQCTDKEQHQDTDLYTDINNRWQNTWRKIGAGGSGRSWSRQQGEDTLEHKHKSSRVSICVLAKYIMNPWAFFNKTRGLQPLR